MIEFKRLPDGAIVQVGEVAAIFRTDLGESLLVLKSGVSLKLQHGTDVVAEALGIELTEPDAPGLVL